MLRIAITGGPCGGKSTVKSRLIQTLKMRLGMKVLWVPETPTELMQNGIIPDEALGELFQELIMDKQLSKQAIYDKAASCYNPDNVIIFYDRGILDQAAYCGLDKVKQMLANKGLNINDVYQMYDAVLHLVTAADGAEAFYQWNDPSKMTKCNNTVRSESPEVARELDIKTRNAWIGHPHFRVFDNTTDFNEKVNRVINEVFLLLGEPTPVEIERKFLIKKPTLEVLESLGHVSKVNIIQTYLNDNETGAERRIRQWGAKNVGFNFFYTEKIDTEDSVKRIEKERTISSSEYISLMSEANTSLHQISKERYCFVSNSKYFELDMYPFSSNYALLEVELQKEDEEVIIPKEIEVIKEVTNDKRFRNKYIAKNLKLEA